MIDPTALRVAFNDELQKIAGELQGFTRIGRKPIGVEKLLNREKSSEITPSDVAIAGTEKTSALKSPIGASHAATLALGGLGTYSLIRANQDRKIGKQIRLQSRGQSGF